MREREGGGNSTDAQTALDRFVPPDKKTEDMLRHNGTYIVFCQTHMDNFDN